MSHHVNLEMSRFSLATKAVGLGEEHDNPKARQALDAWIRADLITDIVFELGTPWEPEGLGGAQYAQVIAMVDQKWKNPYKLGDLIRLALDNGVRCHGWDDYGPYDNKVDTRNQTVAKAFRAHFGRGRYAVTQAPGTVVLFGHAHFGETKTSLNRLLLGLNWTKLV